MAGKKEFNWRVERKQGARWIHVQKFHTKDAADFAMRAFASANSENKYRVRPA